MLRVALWMAAAAACAPGTLRQEIGRIAGSAGGTVGAVVVPEAAVALLSLVQEGRGVSAASREMLLADLTAVETGPRRLKGRLPEGTPVAHKTGTSGTFRGLTRATNDIGIITLPDGRHLAVAVFVMDSRALESAREGAIAAIARASWDCWTTGVEKPRPRSWFSPHPKPPTGGRGGRPYFFGFSNKALYCP